MAQPDARLMVIGYSFSDVHINEVIGKAASNGHLRIFVIDPLGVDVMDKNRNAIIYTPGDFLKLVQPHVIGASRRGIREIFGNDKVEHAKVLRFFA